MPKGQEYCVWWPAHGPKKAKRCWVLIPGGMSSGRDFYISSVATSSAISEDESWVVFHNPGQGGSKHKCVSAVGVGLARTDCLTHFLKRLRGQFEHIVVVGFSAGGMPVMAMAQQSDPIADAFVSVCTPDRIRLVFEEHSRWWLRLDIFFALWFRACVQSAGLCALVPYKRLPWPPTWLGFMRPFTERTFEVSSGYHRTFEELEDQHFDGSVKAPASAPCLRILCGEDPIVPAKCLEGERLQNCEVWWEPRGGHCGQFYWSSTCAARLRNWALTTEGRSV